MRFEPTAVGIDDKGGIIAGTVICPQSGCAVIASSIWKPCGVQLRSPEQRQAMWLS
jgi:hypothetical protein